jgi:D-alanyl-D-alanine carboxypeptidase
VHIWKKPAFNDTQTVKRIGPAVLLLLALFATAGCASPAGASWDGSRVGADLQTLLDGAARGSGSEAQRHALIYVDAPTVDFIYAGAAGVARADSAEPMTVNHQYYLASIPKAMTAAVIYQLVEEGAFGEKGIDALLAYLDLLPAEVLAQLHLIDGVSHAESIRLRHLLNHTSGLRDLYFDGVDTPVSLMPGTVEGAAPDSLIGVVAFDEELGIAALARCTLEGLPEGCDPSSYLFRHRWVPWDYEAWQANPADKMAGLLNFYLAGMNEHGLWEPGTGFHYSDTNYVLLGLLVEKSTGNSLAQEVRGRILEPLGMDDSYMIGDASPGTEGYDRRLAEVWAWGEPAISGGIDFSFDWGGGGVVSTLEDLARFVRALVAGDLFTDASTLEEMLSVPEGIDGLYYASGLIAFPTEEGPVIHMMGSTGTWAEYYPPLDLVTVGTVDDADNLPGEFMLHIQLYGVLAQHGLSTPMAAQSGLPMLLLVTTVALLSLLSLVWLIVAIIGRFRGAPVAGSIRLARWLAAGVALANLVTVALAGAALGENQFQMLFGFSPEVRRLLMADGLVVGALGLGLVVLAVGESRRRHAGRLEQVILSGIAVLAPLCAISLTALA